MDAARVAMAVDVAKGLADRAVANAARGLDEFFMLGPLECALAATAYPAGGAPTGLAARLDELAALPLDDAGRAALCEVLMMRQQLRDPDEGAQRAAAQVLVHMALDPLLPAPVRLAAAVPCVALAVAAARAAAATATKPKEAR
jgi:hypothetical protein